MQDKSKSTNTAVSSMGFPIASLVLGILSIVFFFAWFMSVLLGILAIIFGVISLKKSGRGWAIAGIITGSIGMLISVAMIVVILLAFPAYEKSQRDASRKSDVSRISASISEYQANNSGLMPLASELSTSNYFQVTSISSTDEATKTTASYKTGTNCDGVSSSRNYSVTILLEKGDKYCVGS